VKTNKGDLVHVPAGVTLMMNDTEGNARMLMKLNEPQRLLVTEVKEKTYEIFYQGQHWLVDKKKTYQT
jgi:hypothetical protein